MFFKYCIYCYDSFITNHFLYNTKSQKVNWDTVYFTISIKFILSF